MSDRQRSGSSGKRRLGTAVGGLCAGGIVSHAGVQLLDAPTAVVYEDRERSVQASERLLSGT